MGRKSVSEDAVANRTRRAMSWWTLGVGLVCSLCAVVAPCCVLGAVWLVGRGALQHLPLRALLSVFIVAGATVPVFMRPAKWLVEAAERLTRPVERLEALEATEHEPRAAMRGAQAAAAAQRRALSAGARSGHGPP